MGEAAIAIRHDNAAKQPRRQDPALFAPVHSVISPRVSQTHGARRAPSADAYIEAQCRRYKPLVLRMARRMAGRLPDSVELDDLVGAGFEGVVRCLRQHVDKATDEVDKLVRRRVRGSMLDYLRSMDYLSRRQRAAVSLWTRSKEQLEEAGVESTPQNVARAMGVSRARAEYVENRLASVMLTSLANDEHAVADRSWDVQAQAEHNQLRARVVEALKTLPQRLQLLLALHYNESLTYHEISELMQVSKSRVCQLHNNAISQLRETLALAVC